MPGAARIRQRVALRAALWFMGAVLLTDCSKEARLRYDNGYTSYIEILDSERSLFQAQLQLQLTQTQRQLYVALINLDEALGGGWVDKAEEFAPHPEIADTK